MSTKSASIKPDAYSQESNSKYKRIDLRLPEGIISELNEVIRFAESNDDFANLLERSDEHFSGSQGKKGVNRSLVVRLYIRRCQYNDALLRNPDESSPMLVTITEPERDRYRYALKCLRDLLSPTEMNLVRYLDSIYIGYDILNTWIDGYLLREYLIEPPYPDDFTELNAHIASIVHSAYATQPPMLDLYGYHHHILNPEVSDT